MTNSKKPVWGNQDVPKFSEAVLQKWRENFDLDLRPGYGDVDLGEVFATGFRKGIDSSYSALMMRLVRNCPMEIWSGFITHLSKWLATPEIPITPRTIRLACLSYDPSVDIEPRYRQGLSEAEGQAADAFDLGLRNMPSSDWSEMYYWLLYDEQSTKERDLAITRNEKDGAYVVGRALLRQIAKIIEPDMPYLTDNPKTLTTEQREARRLVLEKALAVGQFMSNAGSALTETSDDLIGYYDTEPAPAMKP